MRWALAIAALAAACSSPAAAPDAGPGRVGDVCGGGDPPCADGLYCQDLLGNCGAGTCAEPDVRCTRLASIVCGCDHEVHRNVCDANASGNDLSRTGGCEAPPGRFSCGAGFCDPTSEYCYGHTFDIDEQVYYWCQPLPSDCSPATCDCFTEPNCQPGLPPACTDTGDGLVVICPPD
jgi:hypothetical protein